MNRVASIQAFVSRAGFFWRGGALSLTVVFGISLVVALLIGDVYEAESIVEFAELGPSPEPGGASPGKKSEEQLRQVTGDPLMIEQLARELSGGSLEGPALEEDAVRLRRSIRITPRGERRFGIAFRSKDPVAARRGSDWLAQAAVRRIEVQSEAPTDNAEQRLKMLDDRTKDLVAFLAEHPAVALSPASTAPSASSKAASSAGPVDSALVVLQQQRGRLEWRIAEAERREAANGSTPYERLPDRAVLERTLAQVKVVIAARQAALQRSETEVAGAPDSKAESNSPGALALQADGQRLMERVVEAELQDSSGRERMDQRVALRIVQRASLPGRPLKPDQRLIALLGLAGGVWAGIIWAFARAALRHDVDSDRFPSGDDEVATEAGGPAGRDALNETGRTAPEAPPLHDSTPNSGSPVTARDGGGWQLLRGAGALEGSTALRPSSGLPARLARQLLATERGVVDVSRVRDQTGTMPNRIPPIQAVPIVEVGRRADAIADQPSPAPTPDAPPDPWSPFHANPQAAFSRASAVTQSFASPFVPPFDPEAAGRSPSTAPAPRPAAGRSADSASSPGPASPSRGPSPAHPTHDLALRSKPPDDVLNLRDVPVGWSPHPSMMQTGSMNELLTLRDQLYRLAVNGCFVVGVTSGPRATSDKSCIAAQLASVLAGPGKARVLLVEANFDRPAVHRLMRIEMPFSQGFSEQMRKRMMPAARAPWMLFRCAPNLHVLAEGLVRSPGLLSSLQFGEAIAELRGYYDLIVADGPMAESTNDTRAFDALMDGIVIVGAVGSSPSAILEAASNWFRNKQLLAVISADASAEARIEFEVPTK